MQTPNKFFSASLIFLQSVTISGIATCSPTPSTALHLSILPQLLNVAPPGYCFQPSLSKEKQRGLSPLALVRKWFKPWLFLSCTTTLLLPKQAVCSLLNSLSSILALTKQNCHLLRQEKDSSVVKSEKTEDLIPTALGPVQSLADLWRKNKEVFWLILRRQTGFFWYLSCSQAAFRVSSVLNACEDRAGLCKQGKGEKIHVFCCVLVVLICDAVHLLYRCRI